MFPTEKKIVVENILDFSAFPTTFTFHNTTNRITHSFANITALHASDLSNPFIISAFDASIFICENHTYVSLPTNIDGLANGTTIQILANVKSGTVVEVYVKTSNIVNYVGQLDYLTVTADQTAEFTLYNRTWLQLH